MYVHNFFPVYKGEIAINDGVRGCTTKAKTIIAKEDNGETRTIKTGFWRGKTCIREWKDTLKGKVTYWMRFGAFERWDNKEHGRGIVRYHPDTMQRAHGIAEVFSQKFKGLSGTCKTQYSWGRMLHQEFWYSGSHRRAYSFHHNDKAVVFKYPDGKICGEVSSPAGFKIKGDIGDICFTFSRDADKWEEDDESGTPNIFDFSKNGNCQFVFYDRRGHVRHRGQYQNRQRTGEWVLNGHPVYFVHGVAIAKKLWDTPPEKLSIKKVIRIKNAQMRAALLAKIGPERLVKGLKGKTIDATKTGMRLIQLPIKLDEGRGKNNQHMRILQVTCPSTKTKYYLNVPDYIAKDGEKRIKLDKCEAARQWTMMNDNPKKRIKFAVET